LDLSYTYSHYYATPVVHIDFYCQNISSIITEVVLFTAIISMDLRLKRFAPSKYIRNVLKRKFCNSAPIFFFEDNFLYLPKI